MVPLTGIWGNLAVITAYVVSRTYGAPLVPRPELRSTWSGWTLPTAAELGLGVLLVTILREPYKVTINAALLAGAAIWALRLAGILP